MKKILILGCLCIIVLVSFSVFLFNPDRLIPDNPAGKKFYYTVITEKNRNQNDEQRFEYKLMTVDKKGKEKKLSFTTSKQIREGAYIKLYVTTFRGVTYWEEIQSEELPKKVKKLLSDKSEIR